MPSPDSPRIFVPPPLIVAVTLLVGLWFDGRLQSWPNTPPLLLIIGSGLTTAGFSLIGIALRLFRRARTRPEPWQPATELVQTGIYRFTRNPMYLGMLVTYAGVALMLQSPAAGLLLIPLGVVIDRFVIAREEAYLRDCFGRSYDVYRSKVRRWL